MNTYAAFAMFAVACFASTASALTVYPINNGFEQPDLGSGCFAYQYNPPSPGWTFLNSSGIAANESCFGVAGATNGNNNNAAISTSGQAGLLQGGDGTLAGVSFSQTLSVPAAGNWVAYFSLEGRPDNDGANGVNVFFDGAQVGNTLFPAALGSFNGASVNLGNLSAGSHTIAFAGTIPEGDHTTFIDNVRLAKGATGDLFASINGGNRGRPIYDYTPLQTAFTADLPFARGLAFDSVGNLFVATNLCDDVACYATILKITPAGTQSTFATLSDGFFAEGVVTDGADNVFVDAQSDDPNGASTIFKFAPNGTQSIFGSVPGQSFGPAFVSAGNLYVPGGVFQTIYKFTPDGTRSIFVGPSAFRPDQFPTVLAFDRFGNLFVSTPGSLGDEILKFTPTGIKTTFATGLNFPRGLAFDNGGNLFVAELGVPPPGDILKFTPGGKKSVFASGFNQLNRGPQFLAIQPARAPFDVVASVPLQTNALAFVAVNEALNKIYTSGGASGGQDVVVIDGTTFAATDIGTGSGASLDLQTNHYWAANVYGGAALVRDGNTDNVIAAISLGFCPINTAYDSSRNREWVGAQCGPGNDPVFAVDAGNFNVIAGPIYSGGVMGSIIANGATGRLYLTASGVSKRVDPTTFAVTTNAFGRVMAVNAVTNRLYAASGNNLQIINGATNPERILTNIALSYTPASIGVNTALNHLYLANPVGNNIEVRSGSTGALIATFSIGPLGANPDGAMAVDSTRGRIYAIASSPSGPVLLVINDLTQ
jgi:sugar lactone lactonase YvrE